MKVPLGAGLRPQDPEPLVGDEDGLVDAQDVRVATSNPGNLKQCLDYGSLSLISICDCIALLPSIYRLFFTLGDPGKLRYSYYGKSLGKKAATGSRYPAFQLHCRPGPTLHINYFCLGGLWTRSP